MSFNPACYFKKKERRNNSEIPSRLLFARYAGLTDINNDVIVDDVEPAASADKPEPEVDNAPPASDGGEDLPRPEEGPAPCEEREAQI